MPFTLEEIASKGISTKDYNAWVSFNGHKNSEGVYWLNPLFFRGEIEPSKVGNTYPEGLEEHLKLTRFIDMVSDILVETAETIKKSLPPKERNNAYLLSEATTDWLRSNIEYIIVPNTLIIRVTHVIRDIKELGDGKINPYQILKNSLDLDDRILRKAASQFHLKDNMSDREIAKGLMKQVQNVHKEIQKEWTDYDLSARETLIQRSGKCTNIANTFVALLRSMGIPCRRFEGFSVTQINPGLRGEPHAWASAYIPNYGWMETETTFGGFNNFSYDKYAYEFPNTDYSGLDLSFIGEGERNRNVEDTIRLVKEGRSGNIKEAKDSMDLFDRVFKTRRYKTAIGFEKKLEQELEFLESFR